MNCHLHRAITNDSVTSEAVFPRAVNLPRFGSQDRKRRVGTLLKRQTELGLGQYYFPAEVQIEDNSLIDRDYPLNDFFGESITTCSAFKEVVRNAVKDTVNSAA